MVDQPKSDRLVYNPEMFVNRAREIEQVLDKARRMARREPVAQRVVLVYGQRGSGKTWLLHELEHQLAQFMEVTYLDLVTLDSVQAAVARVPSSRPLALLLDHVEEAVEGTLDRLEEQLLAPLAQQPDVLIVLAQRGQPHYWASPEFREKSVEIDLGPFGPADIQSQMHKQIPKLVADAAELQNLSGGYPWATYLLARYLPDKRVALEHGATQLLHGVVSDDLRPYFEALSVLRAFDEARMAPLLPAYSPVFARQEWDYAACRRVRARVIDSALAHWQAETRGYVIDEPVRRVLEAVLQGRDPGTWARLHQTAYRMYQDWAEEYLESREWWQQEKEYHAQRLRDVGFDPAADLALAAQGEPGGGLLDIHTPSDLASSSTLVEDQTRKRNLLSGYIGARVTRLVNRDDIMNRIQAAIQDPGGRTYLFYIEAPGGTGKTFLIREVLCRCQAGETWAFPSLLAAQQEVDMYHYENHSREGFMAGLVKALAASPNYFASYETQRQKLEEIKYDLRGAIDRLRQEHEKLAKTFLEQCERLGEEKRVVIALDTVENLVYETDHVQQILDLSEEKFGLQSWLLHEWLPRMHNAVILVCGRPHRRFAEDLRAAADQHPGIQLHSCQLGNFDERDTLAYFDAVRETAQADGSEQALKRLDAIPAETRRVIYRLSEGHPITLALIVDYYLATGRLLLALKQPLIDIASMTIQDLEWVRSEIKADIVRQFQDIGRPADEVIIALAWTPKGMDAALLAHVTGLAMEEAQAVLQRLADPRAGLSFLKIRPEGERVFLHDVMYELMKEYVLDLLPEAHTETMYKKILDYYASQIVRERANVQQLGRLERSELQPDQALAKAITRLQNLLVEEVYYKLRHNPLEGFAAYCEYSDEAIQAHDASLDMKLHDEVLSFARAALQDVGKIEGLQRGDVERDMALRWVWRMTYAAKQREALRIARYLRTEQKGFLDEGGPLAWIELDIWESLANAFLGIDFQISVTRLQHAIRTLSGFQPTNSFEQWRRNGYLARSYYVLGYLLRLQGRFRAATAAYYKSLPLWRERNQQVDKAETLNNLAWAEAEVGRYDRARRHCQDGLALREALGQRYSIALSYNTLGMIEIRTDRPHRGRVYCERALAIFRDLAASRGVGLACIGLAEAHRRSAGTPEVYFDTERADRLRLAAEFANQAVHIFRQEVPEQLRLVEALIELGCVYRELVRLRSGYYEGDGKPGWEELATRGIDTLLEAARLAGEAFLYRQVDALVNLAWLYFYAGRSEAALHALNEAEGLVPAEYYITRQGIPQIDEPIPYLWVQLGKAHLLRGQIALAQQGAGWDEIPWQAVAEQFTLALAYFELFADDFRDIRQAVDTIYGALRETSKEERRVLVHSIDRAAQEYHLRRPPRMQRLWEEYFGFYEQYEEPQV